MATNFESIYEKFLMQIDDYELGIIEDLELNNICFGYLEKARALYFPQCSKNLDDVTINQITYINGVRIEPPVIEEPVIEEPVIEDEVPVDELPPVEDLPVEEGETPTEEKTPVEGEETETPVEELPVEEGETPVEDEENVEGETVEPVAQTFSLDEIPTEPTEPVETETETPTPSESTEAEVVEPPSEVTETPTEVENTEDDKLVDGESELNLDTLEEDFVVLKIEGQFNEDLTNSEQYILALGMKKAWLSSKKFSADLMSKDIGDRDYKAVQGFNYIKELRGLDIELDDEIRKYGVSYTYNLEDLTNGW